MKKYRQSCAALVALFAGAMAISFSGAVRSETADGSRSAKFLVSPHLAKIAASMPPGWQAIPNTRFRDVTPKKGETEWGTVGPKSVLIAWNNLAFDGEALYAHGGGHADYGGNEVYRFSLSTLKWERITEPSPYPPRILKNPDGTPTPKKSNPARCPAPMHGPPSSHTYDGKFVVGGKLWVSTVGIAFCPSGVGEIWYGGLWSMDLKTKRWERVDPPIGGFPLTAVLPNGTVYIGDRRDELIYNPRSGRVLQRQGGYGSEGDGSAVYDPKRNRVWITNRYSTAYIPLTRDFRFAGKRTKILPKRYGEPGHVAGIQFNAASAIDPVSGRLLRWGGGKHVVTYAPETDKWEAYDFPTGPNGRGPLYDRLFPLPGHDGVFIAVSNNIDENVWLLKLPQEPGQPVPLASLQSVIDTAPPGGHVRFEPGLYSTGAYIKKPLTVDFAGVTIASPVGKKAAVVVRDAVGVTIENLTACGLGGSGNIAAIKAEGKFDLTVRKLKSCDNEMGLLTDNKGGRLVIENSVFENMGRANGSLGHLVYAGEIDELVLRDSVLRCSRNGGHLVKSRARKSLIERNLIAQTDCNTSRLIDLPAGGENVVRGNVLQQGPRSQNAEMIGTALETRARQWPEQTTLIEGNLFVSDLTNRPGSSVPAVYKTREGHAVTARGNRIVWTNDGFLHGIMGYLPGGERATIDRNNREFIGRKAAGLPPFPELPLPR
jgi:hypothetical protein